MNKLKTLKDIEEGEMNDTEEISPGKYRDVYCVPAVSRKELRQEAIKWIKNINLNKELVFADCILCQNTDERSFVRGWIKHFFNITKEDLK